VGFRNHFSRLAGDYARYRPRYPDALFEYLASVAPARQLAWDCGTGNGQAALGLAQHFDRVVATDASAEQIAQAQPHDRIEYRVAPAEHTALPTGACDLVTVAQAVHWFDLDAFYAEARRALKPDGVLAVWTYHLPAIAPAVDAVVSDYYSRVLAGYWPERFHYVHERYQTLPFPFAPLAVPAFDMSAAWTLDQLAGFLASWSASQRYLEREGRHPLTLVWDRLAEAWGDPDQPRPARFPLNVRAGRSAAA
jgi:SAM-dependent methyltransferase